MSALGCGLGCGILLVCVEREEKFVKSHMSALGCGFGCGILLVCVEREEKFVKNRESG